MRSWMSIGMTLRGVSGCWKVVCKEMLGSDVISLEDKGILTEVEEEGTLTVSTVSMGMGMDSEETILRDLKFRSDQVPLLDSHHLSRLQILSTGQE